MKKKIQIDKGRKEKKEQPLKIERSFEDVLKVSIPKKKETK